VRGHSGKVSRVEFSDDAGARKHGFSAEPVSAYVGSSKNLKDLKDAQAISWSDDGTVRAIVWIRRGLAG